MTDLNNKRLLELLADQTIFGLDEDDFTEMKRLKGQFPEWENDVTLELAAAAVVLSRIELEGELPANLRTKIFSAADIYFGIDDAPQKILSFSPKSSVNGNSAAAENVRQIIETKTSPWQWLGWAFAAAACIALAVILLAKPADKSPEIAQNPAAIPTPQPELSIEQKRERLLVSATDTVKIPLTNPKNEKEIVGDMVWSNAEQKGYAHFTNLPVNDAARETYQLWIVDETQDAKTPLSGGVFNVSENGEITVPVNAQLQVRKPKMIAVTVEKPGGVVVSKQEKVVALAKI